MDSACYSSTGGAADIAVGGQRRQRQAGLSVHLVLDTGFFLASAAVWLMG